MDEQPRKSPEVAPEVAPEAPGSRWLTMPAVGDLLGLSERAARDWVKRHDLPTRGSRPARVSEQTVLAAMAQEERVARKPPEVLPEVPGSFSEVPGVRPEAPGSDGPIEAAYRVAGEAAAEVALVPLVTMVEELRGLADQLQEMSRRNETLALEVGTLRERQVGHESQLAAKEQTIATQAEALAEMREQLRAERLRLGIAEANVERLERFYDPARWSEDRRRAYHRDREDERADDARPDDEAPGWWGRLLARFRAPR